MNFNFLILAILVFSPIITFGQNLYQLPIEELEVVLDTTSSLRMKVEVYNELAFRLLDINSNKAKVYADSAILLADSIAFPLGKSYSLVTLGLISKRQSTPDLAERYFLKALTIRETIGTTKQIASVYNNLGLLFEESNAFKANKYYERGLQVLTQLPNSSIKAIIHNNYGNSLTKEQDFTTAILHLDSALIIRRKKTPNKSLGNSYLNLAKYYYEINDTSKFRVYIDSSLYVFNLINDISGKAKNYNLRGTYFFTKKAYQKAIAAYEEAILLSGEREADKFLSLKNIGAIKIRQGKLDQALKINKECLEYFESISNDREIASTLINLGAIFYEKEDYEQAIEYYDASIKKLKNIEDLALKSKASLFLSASYAYLGDLKRAADIHIAYLKTRELYYEKKKNGLNTLLDDNDLLLQNAELKVIEMSNKLELKKKQAEKNRIYTIFLVGIIFFLFLLAAGLAVFYRQKKQIADFRINDLLIENERTANYARLEEQENERNRIAKDLHDRLGSMLTAIKFSIGSVESTLTDLKEDNRTHYDKVNKLVDEACDEVRNIAHDLRNSTLANFGLNTALESLVNSFDGKEPYIKLQVHNLEGRLNNKIEVNVYLIIQEIISNTLKHAKAKKLSIQINRFGNILNITAEDDGIGFIREKITPGMGLNNIESRVYTMDGTFNLDSGKGNGTTIMIDIPINSLEI